MEHKPARDTSFIFVLIREMFQDEGYASEELSPFSDRAVCVLMALAAAVAFAFGFATGVIPLH
jgi:hypothetical protein